MTINDVVQFNENHKWRGCLGIIREIKTCRNETLEWDSRYMVGVPIPQKGTAFIFVMESENAIEKIGQAKLTLKEEDNDVCS